MEIHIENLEDKLFVRFYSQNNVIDFINDHIYLKVKNEKSQTVEQFWVSVYFNETNQSNSNEFEYNLRKSCSELIFEFSSDCKLLDNIKSNAF
jgi:hypothetical protein